mgnify:FL=1
MFLTRKKTNGIYYLYLMESIHVKGKRNPKKRTVRNYGRYDDAPEEMRRKFEDAKAKKELEQQLEREIRRKELSDASASANALTPITSAVSSQDSTNFNKAMALCYGHIPLKTIWDKDLGLRNKIDYFQKRNTDITAWRLNDVLFYLSAMKVIAPASYLGACEVKSNFLYCPWNQVAQDNFYKVLDFVYDNREALIKHAVKSHMATEKSEIKVAFFDCTNTWFETPYDDITWQTIRFTRKLRSELLDQGYTTDQIEKYLDGEEFAQKLATELEACRDEVLRMRGKSKEGRYSQPIVTVALAIDQTGFPIDCKVFAGNLSELRTIKPVLESLKKKYAVKDVYFVADRGLNSTESLSTIREEKLGFVVAQKVSRQKPAIRAEMLALEGYKNGVMTPDGDFIAADNQTLDADGFRYKVCNHVKEAYVKKIDSETGEIKRVKIAVDCKIVYTYSPERKARDLADLEAQIARASQAVSNECLMGNPFGTGWRALVKTEKEAAENKTDKDMYRACGLKDDVIAERKQIAGYAAIVYEHPSAVNDEQKMTAEKIIACYHHLVGIEDCFRVMKSTFSIRPVYVRLKERITAHCYLCVLSLMMLRMLQAKLAKAGHPMASQRVSDALAQAMVVPLPRPAGSTQAFLNIGFNPRFHTAERCGKSAPQWAINDTLDSDVIWNRYEKERESHPDDIDCILQAVNLSPLKTYNTLPELKRLLGLKMMTDEVMLAPEHLKHMERVAGTV